MNLKHGYLIIIIWLVSVQMNLAVEEISEYDEKLLKLFEKLCEQIRIESTKNESKIDTNSFGNGICLLFDRFQRTLNKKNAEETTTTRTTTANQEVKQMSANLGAIETSINATIIDDTIKELNVSLNMPEKRNASNVLDRIKETIVKKFRGLSLTKIIEIADNNETNNANERIQIDKNNLKLNVHQHQNAGDMLLKAVLAILFLLIILALAIFCSRIVYYYNY